MDEENLNQETSSVIPEQPKEDVAGDSSSVFTNTINVPTLAELKAKNESPEVLFWVGCAGAYDDRYQRVTRDFVRILSHLNISFGVLGIEESCTGDPAKRAGNEFVYQMQAMKNIKVMNAYGVTTAWEKTVGWVFGCSYCRRRCVQRNSLTALCVTWSSGRPCHRRRLCFLGESHPFIQAQAPSTSSRAGP